MLAERPSLMSACEALPPRTPARRSDRAQGRRPGCPAWCRGPSCAGEHESGADYQTAQHDAVLLSTRLLGLEGTGTDGAPLVMVSLGVQQLELADKPTVELLPEEARRLAASLVQLADLAEHAAGPAPARSRAGARMASTS